MNQRIVCAANRHTKTGEIVIGIRHFDLTMRENIMSRRSLWMKLFDKFDRNWTEEGFVNQYGDFLNRQEAWIVAELEGQIIRRCGGDTAYRGTLYTENLY